MQCAVIIFVLLTVCLLFHSMLLGLSWSSI